jgi:translation elongation factor EF-Tu-like GTPase
LIRQRLFIIEDSFAIARRGVVVTGELESGSPSFKNGSAVVLVHPDGNEVTTEIVGIEFIKPLDYEKFNRNKIGVMLKGDVKREDAPVGTVVFLETSK